MSTLYSNEEGVAHAGSTPRWEVPRACIGWTGNVAAQAIAGGVWSPHTYGGAPTTWANFRGFIQTGFAAGVPSVTIQWPGLYRVLLFSSWYNPNAGTRCGPRQRVGSSVTVVVPGTIAEQECVVPLAAVDPSTKVEQSLASGTVTLLALGEVLTPEVSIYPAGPLSFVCRECNLVVEFLDIY